MSAFGAKRTSRERRERADLTKMTQSGRYAGSKCGSAAGFWLSNLVYIAHDPARGDIRAAPRFERARTAGRYRCLVADPMIGADVAGSGQLVARWADINVAFLIK